ncbi:MAG: transporter substrate-binding domain-containing protein [Rickettsiaceae bacterium]|nr:transporter substrate-binding domain-containing protein [Rickettsiaceae bacterium]
MIIPLDNLKKLASIGFIFMSFALHSSPTRACDEYIIGVEYAQQYPFQYVVNGEFKGRLRDVFDTFGKTQKIKFKYKILDSDSLYEELYNGGIDFKFPDNPTWKVHKKMQYSIVYSEPVTHSIDGIFVNIEDINNHKSHITKFGIVNDLILRDIDKKTKTGSVKITKKESCADLLVLLKNKEVDAIFCNYDVAMYLLKRNALSDKVVFNPDLPVIDGYFYLSTINRSEIIKKFDIWLGQNREFVEKRAHEN